LSKYFSTNLKYLRTKAGLEQMDLADMLGYKSSSGVSEWENGKRIPSSGTLSDIAGILKVTIDDLMNVDLSPRKDLVQRPYDPDSRVFRKIPILGQIAAGMPILATENIERNFIIDPSVDADFIIRVKGTSMINAGILDGDYAFIRQQPEVENGQIAAVMIDGDQATLKRVYRDNGSVRLISENPEYPTTVFDKGDIRIIGKLVAVLNIR